MSLSRRRPREAQLEGGAFRLQRTSKDARRSFFARRVIFVYEDRCDTHGLREVLDRTRPPPRENREAGSQAPRLQKVCGGFEPPQEEKEEEEEEGGEELRDEGAQKDDRVRGRRRNHFALLGLVSGWSGTSSWGS